jgi:hypothetical protein
MAEFLGAISERNQDTGTVSLNSRAKKKNPTSSAKIGFLSER